MTEPLTAGEPLVPPPDSKPPARPAKKDRVRPVKRRRNPILRLIRGLIGLVIGLTTLGGILGAAGAWVAWPDATTRSTASASACTGRTDHRMLWTVLHGSAVFDLRPSARRPRGGSHYL